MSSALSGSPIREHMDVICSEGKKLGRVDHVLGEEIKLTKNDSPDGKHHFIPMSLVDHVDEHVHLSKPGPEVMKEWRGERGAVGGGGGQWPRKMGQIARRVDSFPRSAWECRIRRSASPRVPRPDHRDRALAVPAKSRRSAGS